MSPPLAYFLSWTTYGTWLSGDGRGWVDADSPGIREPEPRLQTFSGGMLSEPAIVLDNAQRHVVNSTIRAHCEHRSWPLHAVNARTNHVHVVVTADGVDPETAMEQLKAWCSRRLNQRGPRRRHWWTRHGSTKWINDEAYFHRAVHYVLYGQ